MDLRPRLEFFADRSGRSPVLTELFRIRKHDLPTAARIVIRLQRLARVSRTGLGKYVLRRGDRLFELAACPDLSSNPAAAARAKRFRLLVYETHRGGMLLVDLFERTERHSLNRALQRADQAIEEYKRNPSAHTLCIVRVP